MKQYRWASALTSLLFGVAVTLFFALAYPHHLHYQEQFQLFLFDGSYVWQVVQLPGGLADLLGRFCTQFFLFAWVGAFLLGLLLMAVQLLTLRLVHWGRLYALSFVPAGLLWLFLLDENALLGGVWAVLLTLLASWAFDSLSSLWLCRILLIVAAPVLYWAVGPVCVLFYVLLARRSVLSSLSVWYYAALLLVVSLPIVLAHYLPVQPDSLWRGIHYHRYPTQFPGLLWGAVLALSLLTLAARALHRWAHAPSGVVPQLLSCLVVAVCLGLTVRQCSNFKAEKAMQYDFMARHQQWNRILDTIATEKPNNQIGVTVQNLALAMRGQLVANLSKYHQNGLLGLLPDVQRDATSPLPTAEAFYQLGMIYVAQRTVSQFMILRQQHFSR